VIMVKSGDKVEAYQWSSADTTWQQIGEVTDAVGSGRKQIYQGIEYDYVFDVDIAENMPPLKLPYNATGMFHKCRYATSSRALRLISTQHDQTICTLWLRNFYSRTICPLLIWIR